MKCLARLNPMSSNIPTCPEPTLMHIKHRNLTICKGEHLANSSSKMAHYSLFIGYITNIMIIGLSGWAPCLWCGWVWVIRRIRWGAGVMGKLRSAGRKAIHRWPWPWCIIVPSDPVNILNHQSKQSDPPANTRKKPCTPLCCCTGSQVCTAPLRPPAHIASGLLLRSCSV